MGPNPFIGVIYHWIGGLASASNFIPFRGIQRWSWEIYWIIQGIAAWIVAPMVLALLLVPHLFDILHAAPSASIYYACFWGIMWGVGGLTFGLSIRYLGIALGYAIALGFCTAFGTLMPPVFSGQMSSILHETSGQVILAGVGVCMLAIAVSGLAGYSKEHEISSEDRAEAGERDFSFGKGLAVAIFAGIMSSCFAYGLAAGKPIAQIAQVRLLADHRLELWQNLPVLVVVLWGGFATNFLWSLFLIVKNRSFAQFAGEPGINPMGAVDVTTAKSLGAEAALLDLPMRLAGPTLVKNYVLAALAGVIWYFQFFFYSMGQTKMGKYDFSSWTLHMASIIIFATLWGMALKEWKGTSRRTKGLVALGLFLLVGSTVVVGYGNYLKVR
ncbi:MAG: L-rhamnose-H+ transport protein [Acidobacteriaceae bacterium]|nr:L-rhamnose-H+ transport protein [Acidobacteriaceae bacterium]